MSEGPLEGVRIADFTWAWAGAHAIGLLAMMGAEAIKIESRKRLDHARVTSITTGEKFTEPDKSWVFNNINLNKLSVTLNLTQPKAVELAKRIVEVSDVVAQNMRPGVMDRLGLGYEALREIKPDIIYLSSSAEGATGPHGSYTGYASNFAAIGGLSCITGYPDGLPGDFRGEIDIISATTSTFAILAALNHRQRTGQGQHIDFSSSESVSVLMGDVLMDYTMNNRAEHRQGNRDSFMAPHNCYRCKGEDKWISIAIANDREWQAFCEAMGNPDWAKDRRFSGGLSRHQHQAELDGLIETWTINHTHREAMEILQKAGVAAVPSFTSADLIPDPHLRERGFWLDVEHPVIGNTVVSAPPWKLSETPIEVRRHAPLIGEHNHYVFGELLGLSSAQIARLEEESVIY